MMDNAERFYKSACFVVGKRIVVVHSINAYFLHYSQIGGKLKGEGRKEKGEGRKGKGKGIGGRVRKRRLAAICIQPRAEARGNDRMINSAA
ncbi:hypothetical protein M2480_001636 [Parabacteroides sp. PFB2-12]|nr:hypothetical protein [Parabacteroides sp. PM6-13]MDH6390661.1 hypothetical protein [Parabacteroides sp. PFB2-12]